MSETLKLAGRTLRQSVVSGLRESYPLCIILIHCVVVLLMAFIVSMKGSWVEILMLIVWAPESLYALWLWRKRRVM